MSPNIPAVYVMRDAQGAIVRLARQLPQGEAGWEQAAGGLPEVQAFLHGLAQEANPLSNTDAGLARVTEDLIDVLINRGVIQFTDLPLPAQAKLLERREARASWTHRLKLLDDNGEDGLI